MPPEQDRQIPSEPPDVLPRGATIGRYVVLALVGRGGMGDVYAAYDPELDRKIALKLLRARPSAGQSTTEGRTRLLREAQAIAKLSHGNVVVVYDVGTFDEAVFIAMEFIDGDTARYWLNAEERDWREVLRVFVAAGRGLAAAHDADLVHRDFKPDNVMVGRDGKVRVMDFGLARQAGGADLEAEAPSADGAPSPPADPAENPTLSLAPPASPPADAAPAPTANPTTTQAAALAVFDMDVTRVVPPPAARATPTEPGKRSTPTQSNRTMHESARTVLESARRTRPEGTPAPSRALEADLTQTGAMLGTPAYMAPEQFAAKAGDARTDQFSFCVALYESLYGERPFEGKSFMALMASVSRGVVREAPSGTKVPSWIRKIVLRGLSPAAEARHPSMTSLLDALERDPSVAHRRWAMSAATVLLAVGVLAGAARSLQARHTPCDGGALKLSGVWEPEGPITARKAAIHRAFIATGKSYAERTFETVRRALDKYTSQWTSTYTEACVATAVRGEQSAEVLDLRMSCLQGRLDSVKALTDLFAHADGSTVEKAGSAVDALGDLDRCSDLTVLRAVVKPPDDPATKARVELLKPRLARVKALTDAGHISEALALARPLADEARAVGYLPLTAQALRSLAQVNNASGSGREALAAEAIWTAQAGGDDEIVAETAVFQTFVAANMRANKRQIQLWADLADSTLRRLGGHELWRAWLINNVAVAADMEARYADALAGAEASLRLKEKILGTEHADVAISLGNVANQMSKLNRIDEALLYSERAVRIDEKNLGPDHPDTALQLENRAELLNAAGHFSEAAVFAHRALAIWERELGTDHPYAANALTILGRSYLGLVNVRDSVSTLERAYAIRQRFDPEPSRLAETEFLLAQALWQKRANRQHALTFAVEAKKNYTEVSNDAAVGDVTRWLQAHDTF